VQTCVCTPSGSDHAAANRCMYNPYGCQKPRAEPVAAVEVLVGPSDDVVAPPGDRVLRRVGRDAHRRRRTAFAGSPLNSGEKQVRDPDRIEVRGRGSPSQTNELFSKIANGWISPLFSHRGRNARAFGSQLAKSGEKRSDEKSKSLQIGGLFAARPEEFESPTFGSVDRRSIQLSYGREVAKCSRGNGAGASAPGRWHFPAGSDSWPAAASRKRRGRDSNPR
jgi:hypothetical protein